MNETKPEPGAIAIDVAELSREIADDLRGFLMGDGSFYAIEPRIERKLRRALEGAAPARPPEPEPKPLGFVCSYCGSPVEPDCDPATVSCAKCGRSWSARYAETVLGRRVMIRKDGDA